MTIADFARDNKGFDWSGYLRLRGLDIATANFMQLNFFKAFDNGTPLLRSRTYETSSQGIPSAVQPIR